MSQPREALTPAEILAQMAQQIRPALANAVYVLVGDAEVSALEAGVAALHREAEDDDDQSRSDHPRVSSTSDPRGEDRDGTDPLWKQIEADAVMVCRSGCEEFGDGNTPLDERHCWACGVSYRMRRIAALLYPDPFVRAFAAKDLSDDASRKAIKERLVGYHGDPPLSEASPSAQSAALRDSTESPLPREAGPGLIVEPAMIAYKRARTEWYELPVREDNDEDVYAFHVHMDEALDALIDAVRASAPATEHFCIRCHHRWTGDWADRTGLVEYCGDCHREVRASAPASRETTVTASTGILGTVGEKATSGAARSVQPQPGSRDADPRGDERGR